MNRKFQTFQKDGKTFLRQVNPYTKEVATFDKYGKIDGGYISYDWQDFEQTAISSAKPLIGNFPVKEVYNENELNVVNQRCDNPEDKWPNGEYTREAYEYIGETHPLDGIFEKEEDDGFFGLVDAVIQHRKNNPQSEYISPFEAERNRIIGLIEAEISDTNQYDTYKRQILRNLLTKIKQS